MENSGSKSHKKCSRSLAQSSRQENDEEVIRKLLGDSCSYNSLIYVRTKLIKTQDGIKKMCKSGCFKQLVSILEKPKMTDIVLSILANCCLDNDVRTQVISCGGTKVIARVFQCLASESIQNRACRALANIGLTPQGSRAVHKEDILGTIVKFLCATKSQECQQTAIRALRILGDIPSHRAGVIQEEGLVRISELLESDNEEVVKCSTKTLAWLTQRCTLDGAQQVHRGQGLSTLVKLSSHADSDVSENALKTLVNLCSESGIRPELGNAGIIPVLVRYSEKLKDHTAGLNAVVSALCLCCREAINRVRIRQEGGLQVLMDLLSAEDHSQLHSKIILSLLAFRYDEACFDALLDLKLVPTLVSHLVRFVQANRKEHFLKNNDEESIGAPEISSKLNDYLNGLIQNSRAALDEVTTVDSLRDEKFDLLSDKISDSEYESDDGLHESSLLQRSNSISKVFCIHSPSYQQVQSEIQSGFPSFLDTYSSRESYNHEAQSPTSSMSYCMSPDCSPPGWDSPPSWSPPSLSPCSSLQKNWSPMLSEGQSTDLDASPLQSPSTEDFCYSPICEQIFSEDENDVETKGFEEEKFFLSDSKNSEITSPSRSNTGTCESKTESEGSCSSSSGTNHFCAKDDQAIHPSTSGATNSVPKLSSCVRESVSCLTQSPKTNRLKRRCSGGEELQKRSRQDATPPSSSPCGRNPFGSSLLVSRETKSSKQPSEDQTSGGQIIQIFSHLSQMEKPSNLMSTESCIISIVDYVSMLPVPSPRAERVLSRLTKNYLCYESLISFGIVRLLQQKLRPRHLITTCDSCNQLQMLQKKLLTNLSLVSESPFGLGVLSHMLLNGTIREKTHCILATPYLVRGHKLLQKLLFECGGLSLLLKILELGDPDIGQAVESLCQLCRQWMKPSSLPLKRNLGSSQCLDSNLFPMDVHFLLDSGCEVGANRSKLCQNSLFFSAMLEGSFMESAQKRLKLPEVSEAAFHVILHFLYECTLESCHKLQATNMDTLLELIGLSDRFLMHNLREDIIKKIIGGLRAESVGDIYLHSLHFDWEELRHPLLRQLLVGPMDSQDRLRCFQKLLLLEDYRYFKMDLKKMVSDNFPERQVKSYTPPD